MKKIKKENLPQDKQGQVDFPQAARVDSEKAALLPHGPLPILSASSRGQRDGSSMTCFALSPSRLVSLKTSKAPCPQVEETSEN